MTPFIIKADFMCIVALVSDVGHVPFVVKNARSPRFFIYSINRMTHLYSVKKPWIVSYINFTCTSLNISKMTKSNRKENRNVCNYSGMTSLVLFGHGLCAISIIFAPI